MVTNAGPGPAGRGLAGPGRVAGNVGRERSPAEAAGRVEAS
jgi:hypothetical protein